MNPLLAPYLFQEELYDAPQNTLIVLSKQWKAYDDDQRSLLSKILGSVKLNLSSVQIIFQQGISIDSLTDYHVAKVLVFGPSRDGIKTYEHVRAQGFSVIVADDLSQLDEPKKKSLWRALKDMYGV